jgi:lipopolysaccharide/colanic/teichoic acid biosynthesis glycosyltransferase
MKVPESELGENLNTVSNRIRRAADITMAGMAIFVTAPLMFMIAGLVLLETGWPILFWHPRIGLDGQPFNMCKFRKFYPDSRSDGMPLTLKSDSRLTRVGKVLAQTKLDELPQLWNILRGDMAIVGPRPESVEFLDCYRDGFEEVLRYRPGLVGPSQIFFRDESFFYPPGEDPKAFYRKVVFPTKAGLDIAYFRHRTLMSDAQWLIRSALVLSGVT